MPFVTTFLGGSVSNLALALVTMPYNSFGPNAQYDSSTNPSLSLTVGTWVITVILPFQGTNTPPYFNTTSGVNIDLWPTQEVVIPSSTIVVKSAVVSIGSTTTVYANGTAPYFVATQID